MARLSPAAFAKANSGTGGPRRPRSQGKKNRVSTPHLLAETIGNWGLESSQSSAARIGRLHIEVPGAVLANALTGKPIGASHA